MSLCQSQEVVGAGVVGGAKLGQVDIGITGLELDRVTVEVLDDCRFAAVITSARLRTFGSMELWRSTNWVKRHALNKAALQLRDQPTS